MSLRKKVFRRFGYFLVGVGVFYLFTLVVFRPSHDRDWELGHEALPHIVYAAASR